MKRRNFIGTGAAFIVGHKQGEPEEEGEPEEDDGLHFGEAYRTPTDFVVVVSNLRLKDSYEYESSGDEMEIKEADGGMQFAFIDVEIVNETGETMETPNILSFEIIAGDTQYETLDRIDYERDDQYGGLNDLADGVSEEGVLPYEIPDGVPEEEIGLFYIDSDRDQGVEWEAIWWAT